MDNILQIKPCANIAIALRNIADGIDNGDFVSSNCTLIIGDDIFHLGVFEDSRAAENAIWDMTYGIHKLMNATTG